MAISIYVIADLIEHSGRRQPFAVFKGKAVERAESGEEQHRGFAHNHRMFFIDVIMLDSFEDRFPAFRFDLPARTCCAVIVCRHLRKDPVAEAQRRIAKAFEPKTVQQFVVHRGPCDDDLGATWPDAFNLASLCDGQASEALRDPAHLRSRHDVALPTFSSIQMTCNRCQRRRGARGRDDVSHLGPANAIDDAVHFARDETMQALQLSLSWRIVPQKLAGEPYGAQRKADSVAYMPAVRNREFATSSAKIKH